MRFRDLFHRLFSQPEQARDVNHFIFDACRGFTHSIQNPFTLEIEACPGEMWVDHPNIPKQTCICPCHQGDSP